MTATDPSSAAEGAASSADATSPQQRQDAAQLRRHIDAFDHLRTHVVIWALIESLEGSTSPVHELLRTEYLYWQSKGDIVRPPEDMSDSEAALQECYDALSIAIAIHVDGRYIDAPAGCRAVELERSGSPDVVWKGFCEACRSSHVVIGGLADPRSKADHRGSA